jgi:hypothetical protein
MSNPNIKYRIELTSEQREELRGTDGNQQKWQSLDRRISRVDLH